jgi:hypothetical protein
MVKQTQNRGEKMKNIAMLIFVLMVGSSSYGKDIETVKEVIRVPMAVEFKENNKFKQMVGRLELDYGYGESITLVTFVRDILNKEHVLPIPAIYKITHKDKRSNNNYYIEGVNQYGIKISGIIDSKIETKPKIDFMLEGGMQIVNISDEGRNYKKKYIPNVELGWEY